MFEQTLYYVAGCASTISTTVPSSRTGRPLYEALERCYARIEMAKDSEDSEESEAAAESSKIPELYQEVKNQEEDLGSQADDVTGDRNLSSVPNHPLDGE